MLLCRRPRSRVNLAFASRLELKAVHCDDEPEDCRRGNGSGSTRGFRGPGQVADLSDDAKASGQPEGIAEHLRFITSFSYAEFSKLGFTNIEIWAPPSHYGAWLMVQSAVDGRFGSHNAQR